MKPSFEKLVPESGQSFRCFERSALQSPVKWHRHPEIELTYIVEGSGSRVVGDHIGSYSDHDLVLSGSQLPHTWDSDEFRGQPYDRHEAFVIQFHPTFLGESFFETAEMQRIAAMLKRASRGLWFPPEIAQTVGREIVALVAARGAARLIGLLSILDSLCDCAAAVPLASEHYGSRLVDENSNVKETKIQTVCDHIATHLPDPDLTHRRLASMVQMNPSAFSRFFKKSTGRTVSAYINELRVGLACRLLCDTDEAILTICHQSGFANLSNFNRRFRLLREMTPREYRLRFRKAI